jgi:protein-disulfide isomerase
MPLEKAPAGWVPSPARGSDDPLVVVHIASDFQCPVCKRAVLPAEQLIRDLPSDVRVEFKHHALSSHARAEAAAVAAMAAHKQGKFWEFHDLLFGNFGQLSDGDFEDYAKQLNLDLDKFRADLADAALRQQVQSEGRACDIQDAPGTPGFFINGKKQVGWGSYFGFKTMVQRELDEAKKLAAQGMSRRDVLKQRMMQNADKGDDFVKHFLVGEVPPGG